MRRLSFITVICMVLVISFYAYAEPVNTDDYSWLDDMTINQLQELDTEIHKRIPYSGSDDNSIDESILYGTWEVDEKAISPAHKGHTLHRVYKFTPGGVGRLHLACNVDSEVLADMTFKFEMKSKDILIITMSSAFGDETSHSFTYYKNDQGEFLQNNNDEEQLFIKTE